MKVRRDRASTFRPYPAQHLLSSRSRIGTVVFWVGLATRAQGSHLSASLPPPQQGEQGSASCRRGASLPHSSPRALGSSYKELQGLGVRLESWVVAIPCAGHPLMSLFMPPFWGWGGDSSSCTLTSYGAKGCNNYIWFRFQAFFFFFLLCTDCSN